MNADKVNSIIMNGTKFNSIIGEMPVEKEKKNLELILNDSNQYLELYTEKIVSIIKELHGSVSGFENDKNFNCEIYLICKMAITLLKIDFTHKYDNVTVNSTPINLELTELDHILYYVYNEFRIKRILNPKENNFYTCLSELKRKSLLMYFDKDEKNVKGVSADKYQKVIYKCEEIRNENNISVNTFLSVNRYGIYIINIDYKGTEILYDNRNGFYNSSKADMLEVLEKNKLLLKIKEHYKSSIFGLLYNNKNCCFFTRGNLNNQGYLAEISRFKNTCIESWIDSKVTESIFNATSFDWSIKTRINIEKVQPQKIRVVEYFLKNNLSCTTIYGAFNESNLSNIKFTTEISKNDYTTDKSISSILKRNGFGTNNKEVISLNVLKDAVFVHSLSSKDTKKDFLAEVNTLCCIKKYGISGFNRIINLEKTFEINNLLKGFGIATTIASKITNIPVSQVMWANDTNNNTEYIQDYFGYKLPAKIESVGLKAKKEEISSYNLKLTLDKKMSKLISNRFKNLLKNGLEYYIKTGSLVKINKLLNTDFNCIEMLYMTIENCLHEKSNYKVNYTDFLWKKVQSLLSNNDWILVKKAFKKTINEGDNDSLLKTNSRSRFNSNLTVKVFLHVLQDRGIDISNIEGDILRDYIINCIRINKKINIRFNSNNKLKVLHDEVTKDFEYHTKGVLTLPDKFVVIEYLFNSLIQAHTVFKYKLISTDDDLLKEGREQKHCVYTYKGDISKSRRYIWTTVSPKTNERITIETTTGLNVIQHKKRFNENPNKEEIDTIISDFDTIRKLAKLFCLKVFDLHIGNHKDSSMYEILYDIASDIKLYKSEPSITSYDKDHPLLKFIIDGNSKLLNCINEIVDKRIIENNRELNKYQNRESVSFPYYKDIVDNLYDKKYIKNLKISFEKEEKKYVENHIKEMKRLNKVIKNELKSTNKVSANTCDNQDSYSDEDEFPFNQDSYSDEDEFPF